MSKIPLTVKGIRCIFIEVILCFSYGNRKVTALLNYKTNKNLISQHFTKKNSLEATPIKCIKITVDGHYVIIYKSYNIITKAKDFRNEI